MCQWKETKTKKGRRRKNSPPISPNQYYQSTLSPPSETKEFWKSVGKGGETILVPILGSECGKMGKEREGGKNWDEMRVSKVKFKELIEGRITPLASDVSKVARLAAIWANRFGIVGNDSSLAIDANQAARRRPRVESGSVSKVTRSDAEKCPRITCFKDTTVSKPAREKHGGSSRSLSFLLYISFILVLLVCFVSDFSPTRWIRSRSPSSQITAVIDRSRSVACPPREKWAVIMAAFVYLPPATGKKKARTVDVGLLPIPPLFDSLFSSPRRCREQSLASLMADGPPPPFFAFVYASARVIAAVFSSRCPARKGLWIF